MRNMLHFAVTTTTTTTTITTHFTWTIAILIIVIRVSYYIGCKNTTAEQGVALLFFFKHHINL
jgi:hypothetical protein